MIATKESTVRSAVIVLLRRKGLSPIRAVEEWDRVYSKQYEQAKPGVTHSWIIGRYTFEFIKQPTAKTAVDLVDVIAKSSQEAHDLETSSRIVTWVAGIAVIVILIAAYIVIF